MVVIAGQFVSNLTAQNAHVCMEWINDKDCGLVISIFRIESYSTTKAAAQCTLYSAIANKPGEAVCVVCACVVHCVALCRACGTVCWRCAPDPARPVLTRLPRRPVLPRGSTGIYGPDGPGHTPSYHTMHQNSNR